VVDVPGRAGAKRITLVHPHGRSETILIPKGNNIFSLHFAGTATAIEAERDALNRMVEFSTPLMPSMCCAHDPRFRSWDRCRVASITSANVRFATCCEIWDQRKPASKITGNEMIQPLAVTECATAAANCVAVERGMFSSPTFRLLRRVSRILKIGCAPFTRRVLCSGRPRYSRPGGWLWHRGRNCDF